MNSMKRQKVMTLKDELLRSVGIQYAIGEGRRNSSKRNTEAEPKQKQRPVVDMSDDESKVWCCKEKYHIGTWNIRSMSQGKLEVVKREMASVNIDILGISELKWMRTWKFNSDDHYIYCGQESLRRNGVVLTVNKRVWSAVLGWNLKNDMMISVHFQDKPFNIRVIQVYAPISNAEEIWSWMFPWRSTIPSRTNTKNDVLFIVGDWNAKAGIQEIPRVTGKFGHGGQNEAGQRLTEFCKRMHWL